MRSKRSLFTLICLFFIVIAYGQQGMPPAYAIRDDTSAVVDLPKTYWQILEDRSANFTIAQTCGQSLSQKFHYPAKTRLDLSIPAYWYRYVLKNALDHDIHIGLPANSEYSTFYVAKSGGPFQVYENGELTPWHREPGFKLLQLVPITLKPGEQAIIYNRIYNTYSFYYFTDHAEVSYVPESVALEHYASNDTRVITDVHDSILFGILVFAALFNFFFFLVVREKVYLYFSIYLLCLGTGRMGDEFYRVFFRDFRGALTYVVPLAYLLTFSALTYFIRALLQSKRLLPRWDKFLIGLNAVYFLNGLVLTCLGFHYFRAWGKISYLLKIALTLATLLTFFLLLGKQKKTDWRLMGAVLPGFVIWGIGYSVVLLYYTYGYTVLGKFTPVLGDWWYVIETICTSWLVIFFSWILLHRFGLLQKRVAQQALEKEQEKNQLISEQKIELEKVVETRTAELKQSIAQLKNTQNQLIQSERMASMGELTAGIAHEIQNPLNFVTNFSETGKEIAGEIRDEIGKGNAAEAAALVEELQDTLSKIHHHGKRADNIVRGMLQHSRSSTGERQPTDVNALVDEFLRLSFHGLRAKDKDFTADYETRLDPALPKIEVIPQEMGRVLLNLFNNAFYAVNQKRKTSGGDYKPTVTVSTLMAQGELVISVKDNGTGMEEHLKTKIMQPFFTTKPTGEGTGLGLSITYDMIVKGYGGSIHVDTKEGEFTEFTIRLPADLLADAKS